MAVNPFDQFDNSNPFDQFDAPPAASPARSTGDYLKDIGKSAYSGLMSIPASVADIPDLLDGGGAFRDAYNKANAASGNKAPTLYPLSHYAQPVIGAAIENMTGIAGARDAFNKANDATGNKFPTMQSDATYEPQTKPGEWAHTAAQFLPAALMGPEGILPKLKTIALPTALSEGGRNLAKGTPYEDTAAAAGALIGGGLSGVEMGGRGAASRIMRNASANATDSDIASATNLMQGAKKAGLNLTMAEALQQVTGGKTGMGRVQSMIENTPKGTTALAPMMAARPAQVEQAAQNYLNRFGPAATDPAALGLKTQDAAQSSLDTVRQGVNATARPFYDQLPGQNIAAPDLDALTADPSYKLAFDQLRGNPELNAPVKHLPDTSLAVQDSVVKRLDYLINEAARSGDNFTAAARRMARDNATTIASGASPEFGQARRIVQSGHENLLDPLTAGPLGDISRNNDIQQQTGALFPRNPPEGMPAITADTVKRLTAANPRLALALLRQHLANGFNAAARDTVAGPTGFGGAQFARNIAGNPEQERTLMSGMQAASPAAAGGLSDLLDAFRATGQRFPARSNTAFNAQDSAALSSGGPVIDGAKEASRFSLTRPLYPIGKGMTAITRSRNTSALIKLLQSDPATSAAMLLRARQPFLRTGDLPYGGLLAGAAAQFGQPNQ